MIYLNCTRRDENGTILERFRAPATHFSRLIADEAVYVDFDRFFIRILSRDARNAPYRANGGVLETF